MPEIATLLGRNRMEEYQELTCINVIGFLQLLASSNRRHGRNYRPVSLHISLKNIPLIQENISGPEGIP